SPELFDCSRIDATAIFLGCVIQECRRVGDIGGEAMLEEFVIRLEAVLTVSHTKVMTEDALDVPHRLLAVGSDQRFPQVEENNLRDVGVPFGSRGEGNHFAAPSRYAMKSDSPLFGQMPVFVG